VLLIMVFVLLLLAITGWVERILLRWQ
jgi:hypothetical protein